MWQEAEKAIQDEIEDQEETPVHPIVEYEERLAKRLASLLEKGVKKTENEQMDTQDTYSLFEEGNDPLLITAMTMSDLALMMRWNALHPDLVDTVSKTIHNCPIVNILDIVNNSGIDFTTVPFRAIGGKGVIRAGGVYTSHDKRTEAVLAFLDTPRGRLLKGNINIPIPRLYDKRSIASSIDTFGNFMETLAHESIHARFRRMAELIYPEGKTYYTRTGVLFNECIARMGQIYFGKSSLKAKSWYDRSVSNGHDLDFFELNGKSANYEVIFHDKDGIVSEELFYDLTDKIYNRILTLLGSGVQMEEIMASVLLGGSSHQRKRRLDSDDFSERAKILIDILDEAILTVCPSIVSLAKSNPEGYERTLLRTATSERNVALLEHKATIDQFRQERNKTLRRRNKVRSFVRETDSKTVEVAYAKIDSYQIYGALVFTRRFGALGRAEFASKKSNSDEMGMNSDRWDIGLNLFFRDQIIFQDYQDKQLTKMVRHFLNSPEKIGELIFQHIAGFDRRGILHIQQSALKQELPHCFYEDSEVERSDDDERQLFLALYNYGLMAEAVAQGPFDESRSGEICLALRKQFCNRLNQRGNVREKFISLTSQIFTKKK